QPYARYTAENTGSAESWDRPPASSTGGGPPFAWWLLRVSGARVTGRAPAVRPTTTRRRPGSAIADTLVPPACSTSHREGTQERGRRPERSRTQRPGESIAPSSTRCPP